MHPSSGADRELWITTNSAIAMFCFVVVSFVAANCIMAMKSRGSLLTHASRVPWHLRRRQIA